MATNDQAPALAHLPDLSPSHHLETPPTSATTPPTAHSLLTSPEPSDDTTRPTPAAARRFARRNLRRTSPTPDVVTSLVRPPSPDAIYQESQVLAPSLARRHVRSAVDRGSVDWTGTLIPNTPSSRRSGPPIVPHPSSLDIPKRYGGNRIFDMYSLAYVAEPDPNLLCPICHDPMVDPVTTPCDHTFCYRCMRQSLDTSPSGSICPIDRDPLVWPNCFSAARLIHTQLNNLVVKCPYFTRGCSKECRREVVELHAKTCKYKDFACPGPHCDKRLLSKPEDDSCPHRSVDCSYCHAKVDASDREGHLLSCPMSKTRCESCWKLVYRNQVSAHLELECEGVVVRCPYEKAGCPTRLMRGQLNVHTLTCGFDPESPSGALIRTQRDLIKTYDNLSYHVNQIRARQEETNRQLNEITASLNRRAPNDSILGDSRTMQDLDAGFEEVHQNLTHLEARQSMWTLNQVMPIREEVGELRTNINMIRLQVNWLLARSREEGRVRAANSTTPAPTIRRDDAVHVLPERRRSASAEGADLPRL